MDIIINKDRTKISIALSAPPNHSDNQRWQEFLYNLCRKIFHDEKICILTFFQSETSICWDLPYKKVNIGNKSCVINLLGHEYQENLFQYLVTSEEFELAFIVLLSYKDQALIEEDIELFFQMPNKDPYRYEFNGSLAYLEDDGNIFNWLIGKDVIRSKTEDILKFIGHSSE